MSEDVILNSLCGVVVLGAPGTGKTTFCRALSEFMSQLDRKHAIVNLDPANDNMEYKVSCVRHFSLKKYIVRDRRSGAHHSGGRDGGVQARAQWWDDILH